MITEVPPLGDFIHPAVFYGSDAEYLDLLVPFVADGLAQGQPVAAAVPGPRLRLLREALGRRAEDVLLLDMLVEGRNPGRIIPAVLRRFADTHPDTHVRIIGEPIWAGRTPTEYPACAQHEALINLAFAGRDLTIACPYDTAALPGHVLAEALATHPLVWDATRRYGSDHYAPDTVVDRHNRPITPAPGGCEVSVTTAAGIGEARRVATAEAERHGLPAEHVADFALITTELVTNSLRHTDGGSRLTVWRDADHLVCTVEDTGQLTDPLAGRHLVGPDQHGGRGLLLVNLLADLVRCHTTPHGTAVHAFVRLAA